MSCRAGLDHWLDRDRLSRMDWSALKLSFVLGAATVLALLPIGVWLGRLLAFRNFHGLLLASILINIPFVVQPIQRAFEAIPTQVREAAACWGMSRLTSFARIELPLAWPGITTGLVLRFAHTLGEFDVVLMVGGSIPGKTKTLAISIYDRVQAFDQHAAAVMSATLLAITLLALGLTNTLARRVGMHRA